MISVLIIFLILVTYILIKPHIEHYISSSNLSITFHDKSSIDVQPFLKYLSNNSITELNYKLNTKNISSKRILMQKYLQHYVSFTEMEKLQITNIIKNLPPVFKDLPFKSVSWNLIKTKSPLEFGYPYTIDKYIMVPENYLTAMKSGNNKIMEEMLIHEALHLIQRQNLHRFIEIYQKEYKLILASRIISYTHVSKFIVTNPDSMGLKWIITQGKQFYYVPMLYLKGRTVKKDAFEMKKNGNTFSFRIKNNKAIKIPVEKLDFSKDKTNKNFNIYDPNETFVDQFIWKLKKKNIIQ